MPLSDHARWRVVLRAAGTVVAVASAVVSIWLIARGEDSKTVQIGVIVGLWAALLGSATLLGTRRGPAAGGESALRSADLDRMVEASTMSARVAAREAATSAAQQAAQQAAEQAAGPAAEAAARTAVAAVQEANAGRELERRRTAELEHERDEATRREFALSLELMLRREMERVLRDELDGLRQEVAALRQDLTEKVPGQIRLERIETTRLIGSDLEALQAEVRRLAEERVALGGTPMPAVTLGSVPVENRPVENRPADVRPAEVRPAEVRPAEVRPAEVRPAEVRPVEVRADEVRPVETPVPAPPAASGWSAPTVSTRPTVTEPVPDLHAPSSPSSSAPVAPPPVVPTPPASVPAPPVVPPQSAPQPDPAREVSPDPAPAAASTSPVRDVDPFAGLPRLSRWVDPFADEPDPTPVPPAAPAAVDEPTPAAAITTGSHAIPDTADDPDDAGPRYVGRRRQPGTSAVHAVPDPAPEAAPAPAEPGPDEQEERVSAGRRRAREESADDAARAGGRRRRRDEEPGRGGHARAELVPDDVLARLLGR